jgi:ABC-2 type transport system permease protein
LSAVTETSNLSVRMMDEDDSQLSRQIAEAFAPPTFQRAVPIKASEIDSAMDRGNLILAVEVPPNFQADLIAGRRTSVQVNVDATAIAQAGNGASYVKNVIADEVQKFLLGRERQGCADQFCHPGEVHCQPEDCLVLCHDAGHQPDHSFDGDLDKGRVDP